MKKSNRKKITDWEREWLTNGRVTVVVGIDVVG